MLGERPLLPCAQDFGEGLSALGADETDLQILLNILHYFEKLLLLITNLLSIYDDKLRSSIGFHIAGVTQFLLDLVCSQIMDRNLRCVVFVLILRVLNLGLPDVPITSVLLEFLHMFDFVVGSTQGECRQDPPALPVTERLFLLFFFGILLAETWLQPQRGRAQPPLEPTRESYYFFSH